MRDSESRFAHLRMAAGRELYGQAMERELAVLESDPIAWREVLVAMKMEIQGQIQARRLEVEAYATQGGAIYSVRNGDFISWRRKVSQTLRIIEDRLASLRIQGFKPAKRGGLNAKFGDAVDLLRESLDLTCDADFREWKSRVVDYLRRYDTQPHGIQTRAKKALTGNGNARTL